MPGLSGARRLPTQVRALELGGTGRLRRRTECSKRPARIPAPIDASRNPSPEYYASML